jgi:hypothetical protein
MLKDRQAVAVKVGWCGVTYYYGPGFVWQLDDFFFFSLSG